MIFDTGTYVRMIFDTRFGYCDTEARPIDVVPEKFIVNGKRIVIEALFATYICSDIIWPKC